MLFNGPFNISGGTQEWFHHTTAAGYAADLQFVTSSVDASDLTTYTFSSVSLGTTGATRRVIVCVEGGNGVGNSGHITGVTVAGNAATSFVEQLADTGNARVAAIWGIDDTSNATGNIVVTFGAGQTRCGIAVYALYDASSLAPTATTSTTIASGNSTGSISLTIAAAGVGVASASGIHASAQTATWTGGLVERYDEAIEAGITHTGASLASVAGASITATLTYPVTVTNASPIVGAVWAGSGTYDRASQTIFNAFSAAPDTTRKGVINTCVVACKNAGVWTKLDVLYLFAAADSQAALINWKNPGTNNGTANGSPTFTADRGYTGNASTSYIDTTYNPFSSGGQFAANDATMFAWNLASSASGTSPLFGGDAGSFRNQGFPNISTNTYRAAIGDSAIQIDYTSNTTKPGLYSASRTASNALASYRNGASVGTDTTAASTGLPNENLSFLRSHVFFGDWQISGGGFGKGLNSTEHAALYSALLAYLQAVGAV